MATLLMPLTDSDFDPTESGVPWRTMRDHGHRVVFATPSGRTARADPLTDSDFDPTESGVPWRTMRDHGHRVVFATPSGRTARADPKMVTSEGLGILSPLLKADADGRSAYQEIEQSDARFRRPISYGAIRAADFDALILTGGHASGMRVYLESGVLQSAVADFFSQKKPVGAFCHGVLLAARSSLHPGKSLPYGKKTTALTKQMERVGSCAAGALGAWGAVAST